MNLHLPSAHRPRLAFLLAFALAPMGCGQDGAQSTNPADLGTATDGAAASADLTMPPKTCSDGQKDGDETDVDCGGSCTPCADTKKCGVAKDCQSQVCQGGTCQAGTCTDGVKNQNETDVDCGGTCPKCSGGKGCSVSTDCKSDMCNANKCVAGALTFATPTSIPLLAPNAEGLATGDFNEDGKVDIAAVADDGLEILLGKGDGTFGAPTSFGPGNIMQPFFLDPVAADFNKDSHLDLAWTGFNHDQVYVALGKGDGTFAAAKATTVSGGPSATTVADFDGDGRLDLAFALPVSNQVAILTGNGDGTFAAAVDYPCGGVNAQGIGALDENGDGKPDLVVANYDSDFHGNAAMANVSLLVNNGGTFAAPMTLANATSPLGIAVADFNGDTKLDFAATDFTANQIVVGITGAMPSAVSAIPYPIHIAAADFTLDGKPDVAVTDGLNAMTLTNEITVIPNNGDGTFGKGLLIKLPHPNPGRIATADFNDDGAQDIATVNASSGPNAEVEIILNTTM